MSELDYIAKGDKIVNGQYRFVSHDQVTAKVHPLLVKYGLVILPSVTEMTQENNRTKMCISVDFVNIDNPQDYVRTMYYGYGVDNGDKGPGKAFSYAYKYALLKTFCLETGDDPDNDANSVYEPAKCLEFDLEITHNLVDDKYKELLDIFLVECAQTANIHVEKVKQEAMTRKEKFMKAFEKWVIAREKQNKNN